jgi:hypothetical protein
MTHTIITEEWMIAILEWMIAIREWMIAMDPLAFPEENSKEDLFLKELKKKERILLAYMLEICPTISKKETVR